MNTLIKRLSLFVILPIFAAFFLTSCSDDDGIPTADDTDQELNIVETAEEASNFTTLLTVATDLGLAETLQSEELTVFAPTDAAFDALPDGLLDQLTDEQLTEIILYHVLAGTVESNQISAQQDAVTEQGERILLQSNANGVTINGSTSVISADISASNGVIHAVDEVLLPAAFREPGIIETAQENGNFTILLGAIEDAGLTTTLQFLGDFTVFAPSDAAFEDLGIETVESLTDDQLTDVLTYHVLDGEVPSTALQPEQTVTALNGSDLFITLDNDGVSVNGTGSVFLADVETRNGVIHAVDQVLLPDAFGNVVDNAVKRYELSTLVDLVTQQNLAGILADADAEYTVFAPTNAAFEAISSTLETLTSDQVTNTLLYHVLATAVESGDLAQSQQVMTLNNDEEILIEVSEGVVSINGDATVQIADIVGTNGVIHIIDAVLIPEALGGGIPTDGEVSANITIDNVGTSAWNIDEIDGEGASGDIGVDNATLTLEEGLRYTITNLGAANHPFQLLDSNDNVLIAAGGSGSLQDDADANVVLDDEEGTISFTLTGALADQVAAYICEFHPSMVGDIVVN
ncbi:fasciclin domain-containing protein [Rhodohalobacter sp. 8-1]|uniref:fasciclin domain-containing protein n=1 Tax=Rhodohalobacter sp. 8-1 TaxID=3131972 RepID=UPI0030EBB20D